MNNSFKISVKNGSNVISFELKNVIGEQINTEEVFLVANEITSELQTLVNTNNRLKELGYKGNFFKFTLGRKCVLSIEVVTELETVTLIKNLEFSFGQLAKLESPIDGLHAIIAGTLIKKSNISKIC